MNNIITKLDPTFGQFTILCEEIPYDTKPFTTIVWDPLHTLIWNSICTVICENNNA